MITPQLRAWRCRFCRKVLRSKAVLEDHIRTHTGERPFSCQQCHYKAKSTCNLRSHYKTVHMEKMPRCNLDRSHTTRWKNNFLILLTKSRIIYSYWDTFAETFFYRGKSFFLYLHDDITIFCCDVRLHPFVTAIAFLPCSAFCVYFSGDWAVKKCESLNHMHKCMTTMFALEIPGII